MQRRSVLAGMAGVATGGAGVDGLATYRWRKRVVVVFAAPGDARLGEQRQVLAGLRAAEDSLDLVLVAVEGGAVTPAVGRAADLRRRFGVRGEEFTALLIGKDGGVKLRERRVLGADLLARTIDAMPMRQAEMRERPRR
jgi:hypothetical protein